MCLKRNIAPFHAPNKMKKVVMISRQAGITDKNLWLPENSNEKSAKHKQKKYNFFVYCIPYEDISSDILKKKGKRDQKWKKRR